MGEPIVLHDPDGQTLNVYTRSQADDLLRGGKWFATAADAKAGNVREEPTPTTEQKLAALEGEAAATVADDTVTAAPPPAAPKPKRTAAKGRQGQS